MLTFYHCHYHATGKFNGIAQKCGLRPQYLVQNTRFDFCTFFVIFPIMGPFHDHNFKKNYQIFTVKLRHHNIIH